MDDLNDIPAPPPALEPPPSPLGGGGYLSGHDDEDEIRNIRRRVTPMGKFMIVTVLVLGTAAGLLMYRSARQEAAVDRATTEGRAELDRITSQAIPRAEIAAQVRQAYDRFKTSPATRMRARRVLAALHDADSMPIMIEGLNQSGHERAQAALAVVEIGMPAAAAARDVIAAALPQTNEAIDRVEVAWAAVVVQEPRAWPTVVDLLVASRLQNVQNLEEPRRNIFDPALLARMAGRERLIQLATRSEVTVRRVAALALGEMAGPEVYDILVTLSRDADADVAREAATGLGRSGVERAGEPITAYLGRHPDARDAVLTFLSQNAGAAGLGVIVRTAAAPEVREQATRLLRELQDPDAADSFVHVIAHTSPTATDERERNTRRSAIFGLADIGDARASTGLLELIGRPLAPGARVDPNMDADARLALDAIRKIPSACAAVRHELVALLANPHADFMRTQILLAIGESGDASIAPQLMSYLSDENSHAGAAVAVCQLHYPAGIARIKADMIRPRALVMSEETVQDEPVFVKRRDSIRAILWTHDVRFAPDLLRIVDDERDRAALREEAGFSLAVLADEHLLDEITNRAMDAARPAQVRYNYLLALRSRSTPTIANRLVDSFLRPGVDVDLMRAAAIAAGFGGDTTTGTALRPLLASTDSNVQMWAGVAAVLCGDAAVGNALLDQLIRNRDYAQLLSGVFVTRSATGNNTGVQLEPHDLIPLTDSVFADGRIYRRIAIAQQLERGRGTNRYDFAMVWLKIRIKSGWDNPLGIGPFDVRRRLRDAARGSDAANRDMAYLILRAIGDRGSLLWLRRQPGDVGERARQELMRLNAPGA